MTLEIWLIFKLILQCNFCLVWKTVFWFYKLLITPCCGHPCGWWCQAICSHRNDYNFDGLVQERHNSSALAMELRLSCTNPSIWSTDEPYRLLMNPVITQLISPVIGMYFLGIAVVHIDGLAQDCSNSSALAMELLQSCTKPPIMLMCRVETRWTSQYKDSLNSFMNSHYKDKTVSWPSRRVSAGRRNPSPLAMELRLSCSNSSILSL